MKSLIDNVFYEFTVLQDGQPSNSDLDHEFDIRIHFSKFKAPMRTPVNESEQSFRLLRAVLLSNDPQRSARPLMARILDQFEVPERLHRDMAEHFDFYCRRLATRNAGNSGSGSGGIVLPVKVCVEIRELSPQRVEQIRGRMELARAAAATPEARSSRNSRARMAAMEDTGTVPARRSAVEALEMVEAEAARECAICLEEMMGGSEVIRMPCMHIYHRECIVKWMEKNHVCPLCRFKMPC
ncbi:hypothetical protein Ancab_022507 [Ancistrocladus abbreviatus]